MDSGLLLSSLIKQFHTRPENIYTTKPLIDKQGNFIYTDSVDNKNNIKLNFIYIINTWLAKRDWKSPISFYFATHPSKTSSSNSSLGAK